MGKFFHNFFTGWGKNRFFWQNIHLWPRWWIVRSISTMDPGLAEMQRWRCRAFASTRNQPTAATCQVFLSCSKTRWLRYLLDSYDVMERLLYSRPPYIWEGIHTSTLKWILHFLLTLILQLSQIYHFNVLFILVNAYQNLSWLQDVYCCNFQPIKCHLQAKQWQMTKNYND